MYSLLADLILVVHTSYVLFVLVGQLLILIGWARGWLWPRNPRFRYLHLLAIGVVAVQSWFGIICPLTVLESQLRIKAGMDGYEDYSFIGYWMSRFLFYEAPPWVFAVIYTLFALLVVGSLIVYPPLRKKSNPEPVR
jgi:hypothetical protein